MKKYFTSATTIIFFFSIFWKENLFAQNIAVNTSGNPANTTALLDVGNGSAATGGDTKGMLIPRVSLTSSTDGATIASPATSLLVYCSGSGGLSPAGYYYNSGTPASPVWVRLLSGGSPGTAWMITGNASTTDGTHFLGTTDNVPLNFRVNNDKAGRIDNTLGNAFFGFWSGYSNTSGNSNVAIGSSAMYNNTTGSSNVSIGSQSLTWNSTGSFNTGVGYQSLYGNCLGCTGNNNTALGSYAMYATNNGTNSVGIGYFSLSGSSGSDNTAVGYNAINFGGTGSRNTAVGSNALTNPQVGSSDNAATGYYALYRTNGSRNSAFGVEALGNGSAIQGSNITAIGYRASYGVGGFAQGGANNTSIGAYSMYNKRDEADNIAIGYRALYTSSYNNSGTGTSFYNIAIGNDALYTNNSTALPSAQDAFYNTAIGHAALYSNTIGAYNTATGYRALYANTSGTNATAIGYQALYNKQQGTNNTAIGYQAYYGNAAGNGSNVTAVGTQAGYSLTSGNSSVFVGYQAGYAATSGANNIAIGNTAMGGGAGVTANNNVAVGTEGLNTVTSGAGNTAIGHQALKGDYTGSNNVGVGYGTGANACFFGTGIGSNNTFVGYQSGNRIVNNSNNNTSLGYQALMGACVGTSGGNNTGIGYQSLVGISTGNNNIALGHAAGDNITTGSNNLVIGYDIDAPVATSSNQMSIGNLLFGTGINGTGTTISTGNIGIATNAPSERLHVVHSQNAKSRIYLQNATAGTDAAAELFIRRANNNIVSLGIGDPTYAVTAYPVDFRGAYLYTEAAEGLAFRSDNSSGAFRWVLNGSGIPTEYMRLTPTGNLGIGTTVPSRKFDIHGGAFAAYAMFHTNFSGGLASDGLELSLGVANEAFLWNYENGYMQFATNNTGRMIILANGNVGIGNAIIAPGELLEIGTADATMRIRNTNDAGGGFVGNTWSAVQLGMYNPTAGAWGVLAAGAKRSFFGFDVNGTVGSLTNLYGSPVFRNKLDDGAGNMCYATSIAACSDVRYKKDITPLPDALNNILQLQGVNYFWRIKEFPGLFSSDKNQIGFIAQEVEKIYPELVLTGTDGYKSVDYSRLTPILVEAIKEQQAMIEKQNARIEKLEALMSVAKK